MLKGNLTKGFVIALLMLVLPLVKSSAQDAATYIKSLSARHLVNRGVQLSWSIKYNDTTAYFLIERSLDGQHFEELGEVSATNTETTFKFIDYKPYAEVSYYRIKVIDYDGNVYPSSLVSVYIAGSGKPELVLYPMPVGNSNSLNLDFRGIEKEFGALVTISDQFGRQVLSKEIKVSSMNAQSVLDLEGMLSAGNYQMTVLGHSGQQFKIGKLIQIVE